MKCKTRVRITLQFDDGDPVIVNNKNLIKKFPTLIREVQQRNPAWERQNVEIAEPIRVPFPRFAGIFILRHAPNYKAPELCYRPTLNTYPEAARLTLNELREVIEIGSYFENMGFVDCIGFVIARKLEEAKMDSNAIARFLGLDVRPGEPGPSDPWGAAALDSI